VLLLLYAMSLLLWTVYTSRLDTAALLLRAVLGRLHAGLLHTVLGPLLWASLLQLRVM